MLIYSVFFFPHLFSPLLRSCFIFDYIHYIHSIVYLSQKKSPGVGAKRRSFVDNFRNLLFISNANFQNVSQKKLKSELFQSVFFPHFSGSRLVFSRKTLGFFSKCASDCTFQNLKESRTKIFPSWNQCKIDEKFQHCCWIHSRAIPIHLHFISSVPVFPLCKFCGNRSYPAGFSRNRSYPARFWRKIAHKWSLTWRMTSFGTSVWQLLASF